MAAAPGAAAMDLKPVDNDDDVDSEAGDSLIAFDYAAIEEAQRIAASLSEAPAGETEEERKRKQRGGCKESQKKRKRQRREDDITRAKQAGLPVPSLKELLAAASANPSSSSSSAPAAVPVPVAATASAASPAAATGMPGSAAAPAAAGAAPSAAAEAGVRRLAKEATRRSKVAQALNARTVFVTNLPFKVTEREISDWLGTVGKVKGVRMSKDKATAKSLGYAHVQFEKAESVAAAIEKCDRFDVQGRVVRLATVGKGERCQFDLPEEMKQSIITLIREGWEGKADTKFVVGERVLRCDQGKEWVPCRVTSVDPLRVTSGTDLVGDGDACDHVRKAFEGMNISSIKDAWQKRHAGQKLDTTKYGFKNFSTAMQTIEGLSLEHHVEKKLTFLAFFKGSAAHVAFLEEQAKRDAEAKRGKLHLTFGANGKLNLAYRRPCEAVKPAAAASSAAAAAKKRPREDEEGTDGRNVAPKLAKEEAISAAQGTVPPADAVMA